MDTTFTVLVNSDLMEVRRRLDSDRIQIPDEYLPMAIRRISESKQSFEATVVEILMEVKAAKAEIPEVETTEVEVSEVETAEVKSTETVKVQAEIAAADFDCKVKRIGIAGNILLFLSIAMFIIGDLLLDTMLLPLWVGMMTTLVVALTLLVVWAFLTE